MEPDNPPGYYATVREHSAIHAWPAIDPAVELTYVDVPGAIIERFEAARKVTQLDVDTWHYEYAIRNVNSDRSARAFSVDFADGTPISGVGFHDIDSHSGEPYSTTDWTSAVDPGTGTVAWSTSTFAGNPNANALRWSTMYSFRFDADAPPASAVHSLELFKPGSPTSVSFVFALFSDGFASHNLTAWSSSNSMNPRPFPLEEPPMPTQTLRLARIARFAAGSTLLALAVLPATLQAQGQQTSGPDVTVIYIGDTTNYGASGGIRGYAIGTTSCNIGTTPVNWCDNLPSGCSGLTAAQHPVIAQNMYRLLDGRFEQIGMSWLKHGFVSTNSTDASCLIGHSCASPPRGGNELGVGCTDTYGAGLNGGRPMGMRSEVNPTTGVFPFPETQVNPTLLYEQRIKVAEAELALPGAAYWVEGQYIADNDAVAGNGFNNASYRSITVSPTTFNLSFNGSTIREKTAIQAWKTADAAVETFNEDFCSAPEERFEVARKVTVVDGDTWHYEYVVRNLNSDHAAGAFSVDFPDATPIANVGFNDIEHHSGEPFATTDWTSAVDGPNGTVRWFTEDFAANQNANALRWATMFSFWFDADAAPQTAAHAVDLFKPIPPAVVDAGAGATICAGDTVQLGTPAVPGQTYLWSPGGATTAQIDVSPMVTTAYTLTAATSCCDRRRHRHGDRRRRAHRAAARLPRRRRDGSPVERRRSPGTPPRERATTRWSWPPTPPSPRTCRARPSPRPRRPSASSVPSSTSGG